MAINPLSNALEDFIDEYSTSVIFKKSQSVFKPLQDDVNKNGDDDSFNEALSGAISTLQMGINMMAINYITSNLMPYMGKRASAYFAYIVGGKFVKGMVSKIKTAKLTGKVKKMAMGTIFDSVEQRTERAKIANDMISHVDMVQLKKEQIGNDTFRSHNSSFLSANSQLANKSLALYTEKTKSGTWTRSLEDKKIYERATGRPLSSKITWSVMASKLNTFSEFARSAENEILNSAQVQLDTFTANGSSKV